MENEKTTAQKIGGLLSGIAACLLIIYVVGPWLDTLESIRPLAQFIDDRNIDANAYYYTEVEEFADAELNMKNTMYYMPK